METEKLEEGVAGVQEFGSCGIRGTGLLNYFFSTEMPLSFSNTLTTEASS
jgi:hypothetical protein